MGKTTNGKTIMLNRTYKSTPDYTVVSRFEIGQGTTAFSSVDTALGQPIPITNGTVNDDGSNTANLVGTNGAANSTDNAVTFKAGAGTTDVTAQNLVTNGAGVNATKTWTIANLAAAGTVMTATEPFGFWLYIDDAADLAKFLAAGTCLEIQFRTTLDAANLFFAKVWTLADLAVGWNWLTSDLVNVEDLTDGAPAGDPSGVLDEVIIEATTANATDEFNVAVAGELVFDLLRQWATTDLYASITSGYPILDETNLEVEQRGFVASTSANGFLITEAGDFNSDATMLIDDRNTFTAISKSSTDQIILIWKDRIL